MKLSATFYVLESINYTSLLRRDRYPTAAAARKAAREGWVLSDANYVASISQEPVLTVKQITVHSFDLAALNDVVTGTQWDASKVTKSEKSMGIVDVSHLSQVAQKLSA